MSDYNKVSESTPKYTTVNQNQGDAVRRPTHRPKSDRDFEKVLNQQEGDPEDIEGSVKKDGVGKGFISMNDSKMKDFQGIKKGPDPMLLGDGLTEVDPRFNQVPTLIKDTKLAPKLGTEMLVAPSEEPRAMNYLEGVQKGPMTKDPGTHISLKGEEEAVVKQMPLDKTEIRDTKVPVHPPEKEKMKQKDASKSVDEVPQVVNKTSEVHNFVTQNTAPSPVSNIAPSTIEAPPQANPAQMQNLINQITAHLTNVQSGTQLDTTLEIKNLRNFEGATVTVTSYSTARGEINIAFENLTQHAKQILDLSENRAALQLGLDQKGYTVHMIVTSTVERNYTDPSIADRGGGRGGQQQGQQQNEQEQNKRQR